MKVLHINHTSHSGGAARAMQRLHNELLEKGHQSKILAGQSGDNHLPSVFLIKNQTAPYRTGLDHLFSFLGEKYEKFFGINSWARRDVLKLQESKLYQWADLIDLRNVFGEYFNLWVLPQLSKKKPVVWRLPDPWALTGQCAYPYDCERWKNGCYDCPLLKGKGRLLFEPKPPTIWDGTRRVWTAKKKIYDRSKLHIIVTTQWMKNQVLSGLLQNALSVNVISNGVGLDIFKPIERGKARKELGLPQDEIVYLWAAGNLGVIRKGYPLVAKAIQQMQAKGEELPFLITKGKKKKMAEKFPMIKGKHFGFVGDSRRQALLYSAADVFLCTTLADGQPQTALESMASGTPVVAYKVGPMPEIVHHGETGFLIPEKTVSSLREMMIRLMDEKDELQAMRDRCRHQALMKYDLKKQTAAYVDLYSEILRTYS